MRGRVQEILKQGDALFSKRQPLLNLWQELAEHLYVERADFTTMRSISDDYAGHLMTGFPAMCRGISPTSSRPCFALVASNGFRCRLTVRKT
jgi:hypothetical protein